MTKLSWGAIGERIYETGVDHGVLYPKTGDGVPWNGLTSVKEAPTGGEATPYYIDGTKYLNIASAEEFAATIEAFSAPTEFKRCEGIRSMANGLSLGQQRREFFGLSYRTKIGNDVDGQDHGYKLHLVYNALAAPTSRPNTTFSNSASPMGLSWDITATPADITLNRPTAHLVIDSTKSNPALLAIVEGFLYGANDIPPRLLTPSQLVAIFEGWDPLNLEIPLNFFGMAEETVASIQNLSTNPSFERVVSGTTVLRTNLSQNPSFESGPFPETEGSGSVSSTYTTERFFTGTRSAKCVWVSGNKGLSVFKATPLLTVGVTYTISAWVYWESGTAPRFLLTNGTYTEISSINKVDTPTEQGVWQRVWFTFIATSTSVRVYNLSNSETTYFIDAVLTEQTDQLRPYFDGSTVDTLGWDYSWLGTADASSSVAKAASVITRTNLYLDPGVLMNNYWGGSGLGIGASGSIIITKETGRWSVSGNTCRITATATSTANNAQFTAAGSDIPVTAGSTIFSSYRVMSSVTRKLRLRFRYAAGGGDYFGPDVVVPANTPTVISFAHVVPVGRTGVTATIIYGSVQDPFTDGQWIEGSESLLEIDSAHLPFFYGSSPADSNAIYAWTGTPNASTSIRMAPNVSGISLSPTQGVEWQGIELESKLLNVLVKSGAWGVDIPSIVGTDPDKNYTIITKIRTSWTGQTRVRTGSLAPDPEIFIPVIADVWTDVNVLSPGGAGGHVGYVGRAGDGWIGGDLLEAEYMCIVEGTYDGPYFDGDSPSVIYRNQEVYPEWTGSSSASTSTFEYLTELPESSNEGDAYLIAGNLWVFISDLWHNYGVLPGALV